MARPAIIHESARRPGRLQTWQNYKRSKVAKTEEAPVAETEGFELRLQAADTVRFFLTRVPARPRNVPRQLFRLKTDTWQISSTQGMVIEPSVRRKSREHLQQLKQGRDNAKPGAVASAQSCTSRNSSSAKAGPSTCGRTDQPIPRKEFLLHRSTTNDGFPLNLSVLPSVAPND